MCEEIYRNNVVIFNTKTLWIKYDKDYSFTKKLIICNYRYIKISDTFKMPEMTMISTNKEVFVKHDVKHEQASTAPKLEGVCFFLYNSNIFFYENRYFWPIRQIPVGCLTEMVKMHIYGSRLSFDHVKPSLYDLPFKSSSQYTLKSWKIAIFGYFS